MTNNELTTNVNQETGEIIKNDNMEIVVEENNDYVIKQLQDGTFRKERKYHKYYSKEPETQEEKIELYKVFNSSDDNNELVTPLSNMVGETIGIDQFYTNPYESFDEKTGTNTPGVTTTILDNGHYYATSSKSVYYTLTNLIKSFGSPANEDYKKIYVKVTGTKRQNGVQIDLALSHLDN